MVLRVGVLFVVLALAAAPVDALYHVVNRGLWSESWPAALEPLRQQSRTLVGPISQQHHYAIPFTSREQFEAAWPAIIELRTKGTALTLQTGESFWLGGQTAGVCIHAPAPGAEVTAEVESNAAFRAFTSDAISIELIVDGEIVDLNRIKLPADTRMIDRRFDEAPPTSKR